MFRLPSSAPASGQPRSAAALTTLTASSASCHPFESVTSKRPHPYSFYAHTHIGHCTGPLPGMWVTVLTHFTPQTNNNGAGRWRRRQRGPPPGRRVVRVRVRASLRCRRSLRLARRPSVCLLSSEAEVRELVFSAAELLPLASEGGS